MLPPGVVEKRGHGERCDAKVDQCDVKQLKGGDVAEEVHDCWKWEQVVKDFDGLVVPVVGHDIDEVDDAEQGTDGRVEAKDDEVSLICSPNAVAQEIAEILGRKPLKNYLQHRVKLSFILHFFHALIFVYSIANFKISIH